MGGIFVAPVWREGWAETQMVGRLILFPSRFVLSCLVSSLSIPYSLFLLVLVYVSLPAVWN